MHDKYANDYRTNMRTSAYVSIRQLYADAYVSVSIRQHTSAYVSVRQLSAESTHVEYANNDRMNIPARTRGYRLQSDEQVLLLLTKPEY